MTATLLGLDYGPRKIGIAVGETFTRSARPLKTLRARSDKPDWAGIEAVIREWQPSALVLGLPLAMDGREVEWSARVHRFARQLEGRFRLPVHLIDERLTSVEARRLIGERLATRPGDPSYDHRFEDAVAAALILETWLGEQPRHP